jgi:tungstate transport system permease protein
MWRSCLCSEKPVQASELWDIVACSLFVSGTAVAMSALVGAPLGVLLGLAQFRGRGAILALVHTGMALPPVVVGLAVYLLLSRGGPLGAWGWLFTPRAMIFAQVILSLPFVVGIIVHAIESLPPELPGQIRALGATRRQLHWALVGEARAGVLLAIATAFSRSISEVGAVLLVGGNVKGHTRVLTTAIILETSQGAFGFAIGLGVVLLAIALTANLLMIHWLRRTPR